MNELLQKLAEQATEIIEVMGEEGNTNTHANFHVQKFAELIVGECISVVTSKCASPTARNALIEHFGVEK